MSNLIDNHTTTTWHLMLFNRWFSWRMSMIGGLFSSFVAALIIIMPGIDAALSGFALFFALEYNSAISMMIRMYTVVELEMNAAERVVEYSKLPTESQLGFSPPAHWPSAGRLDISNLSVTYAPDLPCVLKNLTFLIESHQRIGVVGRTGAGKSSLTLALFRFLEAQTGSIQIDGLDISKIKLDDLRSRLAIIPQDPVLFSGTVRSNLDPFEERSDDELMDALWRVHLIPSDNETAYSTTISTSSDHTALSSTISVSSNATVPFKVNTNKNPFTSLSSPISPSGLNLSQGQRQLLCLARANVSRSKIMILDEATSAVDMETDSLIQRSIREDFANSTLIVIAHRLSTVADFDKILVLDQGEIREFGSPRELLEMPGGMFKGMVADSGQRQELEDLILGK
jgi:ABC-type multidrug transport system fused ATPase/permease subunit